MVTLDTAALRRLIPLVDDALSKQEPHIADQLRAAMRDRDTELRFDQSVVGLVAVVVVGGVELFEVDIRNLLSDDEETAE